MSRPFVVGDTVYVVQNSFENRLHGGLRMCVAVATHVDAKLSGETSVRFAYPDGRCKRLDAVRLGHSPQEAYTARKNWRTFSGGRNEPVDKPEVLDAWWKSLALEADDDSLEVNE